MMQRAVFLDRDGVLNQAIVKNGKPYPPATLNEVVIEETVAPALHCLKSAGFLLMVVTNQPDVARGKTNQALVTAIHHRLQSCLPLDFIGVCYHDDVDQCLCRKPQPGLIMQAAADYDIDVARSFIIGDRWKDIEAGKRAGCKTIWLNYQYQEPFLTSLPDYTTDNLMKAALWITNQ